MRLLALCATYGRPSYLLNNAVACFNKQTHQDKYLLIFDDLGNVSGKGQNWEVVSETTRSPDMASKYKRMLELRNDWDAIVIWDDDDLYLPKHLELLNSKIGTGWAKSSKAQVYYVKQQKTEEVETGRGFWATAGISREVYDKVGGFIADKSNSFDSDFLQKLKSVEEPSYVDEITFVYRRFTNSLHLSALGTDASFYENFRPTSRKEFTVTPKFDSFCWGFFNA